MSTYGSSYPGATNPYEPTSDQLAGSGVTGFSPGEFRATSFYKQPRAWGQAPPAASDDMNYLMRLASAQRNATRRPTYFANAGPATAPVPSLSGALGQAWPY